MTPDARPNYQIDAVRHDGVGRNTVDFDLHTSAATTDESRGRFANSDVLGPARAAPTAISRSRPER